MYYYHNIEHQKAYNPHHKEPQCLHSNKKMVLCLPRHCCSKQHQQSNIQHRSMYKDSSGLIDILVSGFTTVEQAEVNEEGLVIPSSGQRWSPGSVQTS